MQKYKVLGLLCITALIVVLLAGCMKGGGTPDDGETTPSTNKKNSSMTLTLVANTYSPEMTQAYEKLKTLFEAAHPGVTVELVDDFGQDYHAAIEQQYSQGMGPDLIQANPNSAQFFNSKGILLDLNPYIKVAGLSEDTFFPHTLEYSTIDDQLLTLATQIETYFMVYDKAWFDKAQIPYPVEGWTWEEAKEIGQKLKNANGGESAFGLVIPNSFDYFEPLVLSNGGSFISPDGTRASGYLNSDTSIETFEWIYQLIHQEKISPNISFAGVTGWLGPLNMLGKQAGVTYATYNQLGYFLQNYPEREKEIGIVGMPKFAAGVHANIMYQNGYGINSNSKNPEMAWELLRFMALDVNEASKELYKIGLNASKLVAEDSEIGIADQVRMDEFEHAMKSAETYPFWVDAIYDEDRIFGQVELMIFNKDSNIREELTNIAGKIDAKLAAGR